jgi:hypothetical protein
MMLILEKSFGVERLIDLERTADSLNGQLRVMRWKWHRAKAESLSMRLWRNLMSLKGGQEFMSDVCNQRARPNTRMVFHADPRT